MTTKKEKELLPRKETAKKLRLRKETLKDMAAKGKDIRGGGTRNTLCINCGHTR